MEQTFLLWSEYTENLKYFGECSCLWTIDHFRRVHFAERSFVPLLKHIKDKSLHFVLFIAKWINTQFFTNTGNENGSINSTQCCILSCELKTQGITLLFCQRNACHFRPYIPARARYLLSKFGLWVCRLSVKTFITSSWNFRPMRTSINAELIQSAQHTLIDISRLKQ